ncbi:MAG: hypothetical protein KJZ73_03570 [Pseudorhodoplanes sp.]|nr:hypothetical protein [Pseudorhodoplanes sp.]GIK79376.1 MAG: hypothetical protein BroJett024_04810 [Alphaproteobacteria bacterium]
MRSIAFALTAVLASMQAHAHPSSAPHAHPHDVSPLPDAGVLVVAFALVAGAALLWRLFKREK